MSTPASTPASTPSLPAIDEDALVRDLTEILGIDSVSGTPGEVAVQEWLARRWSEEGLQVDRWDIDLPATLADPEFPGQEVERIAAVGVTATLEGDGTGPVLLLNGHTDVVPPGDREAWTSDPFAPRPADVGGRESLVARGACDMKAGVVAMWAAVRAVQRARIPLRGSVVLAPVSGEEDGGLGTFALLRHGVHADYCVVTEPTELGIVPANGGALTFRLTVRGRAAHASMRTSGVSTIEKFIPVYRALEELEAQRNAHVDPLMHRWPVAYPLSIGTVQSGDWASTVPDLLVAEGRQGVAIGESVEEARAALEQAVADACARDPWLAENPVEVTWWGGQFASGRTPADSPIIASVAAAHAEVLGDEPDLYGGPYGSDLRLLTGIGGIPTVQYGPGHPFAAHTPDEWVAIEETVDCARVLVRLIVDLCT